MGFGTAWGGRLPCKQEIQMGSIPIRSRYADVTQPGECVFAPLRSAHNYRPPDGMRPYKEEVGSPILSVGMNSRMRCEGVHAAPGTQRRGSSPTFSAVDWRRWQPCRVHTPETPVQVRHPRYARLV